MKKSSVFIICVVLLGIGVSSGCTYSKQNLGIQGELRYTRKKLEFYMTNEAITIGEMTTLSEFQFHLAQMELYHVRYTIWNQKNYEKIEADFQKDEQAWEQRFKDEQEKTSEFEGGSMAPMDLNMRMTAFIEKRIAELKTKWLKK